MNYYEDLAPDHPLRIRQATKIDFIEASLNDLKGDIESMESNLSKLSIEGLYVAHRQVRTLRAEALNLAEEIAMADKWRLP